MNEAKARTKELFQIPYRAVWSGEFEQMEEANGRLMWIIPLSLTLIFILLYSAFRSFLDTIVIFSNVFVRGGGRHLVLVLDRDQLQYRGGRRFRLALRDRHHGRPALDLVLQRPCAQGLPLHEAIIQGAAKRVRPVMMTALTAMLGLLPAAVSTKIGGQTAQPLAIVVVGGMAATLFLTRYLMPVLYSFYGHREPPAGSGGMAH